MSIFSGDISFTSGLAATGTVVVTLDGVDVTNFCVAGSWTRRLNRPSLAQIRVPMQLVFADVGSALKIELLVGTTWQIVHHGRVLLCETDTGEDTGYTVYNSTDPMELWQWRPVRDNTGDFSKPSIESLNGVTLTGPSMVEAMLTNTVSAGGGTPADAEGPIFLDMGTFAAGGVDLTGAPVDWPMTIAQLTSLLISTGELDVVITPTDPGGGVMGTVDCYNGDYGTDLSASVLFQYGTGAYNIARLRQNQDMTSMVNKLWYYAGPRLLTAGDPAGDQHWCFNVTGTDGGSAHAPPFPGPPDGLAYPPGGQSVDASNSPNFGTHSADDGWSSNQLGHRIYDSRVANGVRMEVQVFDANDFDCVTGVGTPGHDLYRYRWQVESWLRADPKELIHITPTRETEIGGFDIGDLVGVEAVASVRGGFSGAQRVYEYTVTWDNDGVLALGELQTSPNNEGI